MRVKLKRGNSLFVRISNKKRLEKGNKVKVIECHLNSALVNQSDERSNKKTIAVQDTRLSMTFTTNSAGCPVFRSCTDSRLKVESVLKPPQKPVMSMILIPSLVLGFRNTKDRMITDRILAQRVAIGKAERWNNRASIHRKTLPAPPPIKTRIRLLRSICDRSKCKYDRKCIPASLPIGNRS